MNRKLYEIIAKSRKSIFITFVLFLVIASALLITGCQLLGTNINNSGATAV